jgi:hypothetical protein
MEPGGFLPRSEQSAIVLCLELDECETHPHIFLQGTFFAYFPRFE